MLLAHGVVPPGSCSRIQSFGNHRHQGRECEVASLSATRSHQQMTVPVPVPMRRHHTQAVHMQRLGGQARGKAQVVEGMAMHSSCRPFKGCCSLPKPETRKAIKTGCSMLPTRLCQLRSMRQLRAPRREAQHASQDRF